MLKNKILLAFLLLTAVFVACEKKDPYDGASQLKIDDAIIKNYLTQTNYPMNKDSSGVYYQTLTAGNTDIPPLTDSVVVSYTASVLKSTSPFKSATTDRPDRWLLDSIMPGLKIGMTKVKVGGQIRLIIPSPLAYKDFAGSSVPPFSILDFTITLIGTKNKNTK